MTAGENSKYWALILGASSGFGGATAIRLAKDGYNIFGVHLDRAATMQQVEDTIEQIKAAGSEAIYFNVNAADEINRKEVIQSIIKQLNGNPLIKVVMHSLAFGALRPFISSKKELMTKVQMEMTLDVMAHSLVY